MEPNKHTSCTCNPTANNHDTAGGLADIYIGTAGYNYAHWRQGVFYPKTVKHANELRHYSGTFAAVEINASFHAVPRLETLRQWSQKAKDGFVFSFKVPQEITHNQRLEHVDESLRYFFERLVEGFGRSMDRLAPILFQLPPSLQKNLDKLHEIGRILKDCNLMEFMIAFEFRHTSWYCEEVYDVMKQYKFGLCENISPDKSTHHVANQTPAGTWHYIRFHKKGDRLVTMYTDDQLKEWAQEIIWRRCHGITQYCYFLNDHEGNGPHNAKTLRRFIQEKCPGKMVEKGNWKPDPTAPSIQSMFAKAAATAQSNQCESGSATKPLKKITVASSNKKRPAKSIQAYFSPTTNSSATKRPKQSPTKVSSPRKENRHDTITSFFSSKPT